MEGSINFTYEELARLNRMIGIALMSGKMNEVSGDKISESVHKKTQTKYVGGMRKILREWIERETKSRKAG